MKVCVVGCGAIGSLFAAHLAKLEDVEVWAFDVDQDHIDAINANGLRLSGESDVHSYPKATSNPSDIPACEFGIVATKSLHTRAA
ncbi:MAG: 2-dehydropantoate 2-reductase, partial [Gammaproteobacteria bacterium]